MKQFDVCENPSSRSRAVAPFVVVLQSHLLSAMPTLIVAPMLISNDRKAYTEVSTIVRFRDQDFIVSAAELVAVDAKSLRAVGNLLDDEFAIRASLNKVFTGF